MADVKYSVAPDPYITPFAHAGTSIFFHDAREEMSFHQLTCMLSRMLDVAAGLTRKAAYRVTFGHLPETRKSMPCCSRSEP